MAALKERIAFVRPVGGFVQQKVRILRIADKAVILRRVPTTYKCFSCFFFRKTIAKARHWVDGRACHDIVTRRFKGFAWIQSDDVQSLAVEEMVLVVAQEMDGAFDDHADFRPWANDGEGSGLCFAAVFHRMVEKNLRQAHVVVVMAVCDE